MIGLYFGSFNPVHKGHTQLAQYLINQNLCTEVWFVVSPHNPLKNQGVLLNENKRLKMLELAINESPNFKICDIEFSMPVPSYTIDTLTQLTANYPEKEFALLIGSDNALVFDQWKEYEDILQYYKVFVYPRKAFDFNDVRDKYPQMHLLQTPYYDISSTEIRLLLTQKKDATKWLHPDVLKYIKENDIY